LIADRTLRRKPMRALKSRIVQLVAGLCAVATVVSAQVPVENLEGRDILPLQENFNAHTEQMRILLLLSPGCGRCLDTSGKVEELLREIDDERIRVLVVWEPFLSTDNYAAAQKTAGLIPDRRAIHYWEPGHVMGLEYGKQLALPGGFNFAVDMVLLFDSGATWSDTGLPTPRVWFHKFGDDERTFSPEKLRDEIRKRLGGSPTAPGSKTGMR
jgi:hypothetical protein